MNVNEAYRLFEALSVADRRKAIRFASIYAADCKRRGKTQPRDIAGWLGTRTFDRLEMAVVPAPAGPRAGSPTVFVGADTAGFAAWVRAGHKPGLNFSRCPMTGATGWWFPSKFPPEKTTEGE
jgi:hypothetical protein